MPDAARGGAGGEGPLVVALGGNAILRKGERGTIEQQIAHTRAALAPVADLLAAGARIVLTHGNGPVVGNILERGEAARGWIQPMPLWIADADSQGGIGVMLQMTLGNLLRERGVEPRIATVVTQVVVDRSDPAFLKPTKPIGPWYDEEHAREVARQEGWILKEQPGGAGWRRVVPSPRPVRIVEAPTIASLVAAGATVIAAGGGGVPVEQLPGDGLRGVDAVIDKDASGALLAAFLDAQALVILMAEERVWLDWGTPAQQPLERVSASEVTTLLAEGGFAEGSVAPKLAAAASFAVRTGRDALICSPGVLAEALAGRAGTRVTSD